MLSYIAKAILFLVLRGFVWAVLYHRECTECSDPKSLSLFPGHWSLFRTDLKTEATWTKSSTTVIRIRREVPSRRVLNNNHLNAELQTPAHIAPRSPTGFQTLEFNESSNLQVQRFSRP